MEFKGTQGKWNVESMDDTFISNEQGKGILCIQSNGCYDYREIPYNAKLISKAPEILEKLKYMTMLLEEVSDEFGLESAEKRNAISSSKELIKEATTI